MKNFIQDGNVLRLYPNENITSGDIVAIGDLIGVANAHYDASTNDGVVCSLNGVFSFTKPTGAWAQGQKIYWDKNNHTATTVAKDNVLIGYASEPAIANSTEGRVRLKG